MNGPPTVPRVEASPTTLGLAVGDAALIALFVVLGELRHGYDPVADPLWVLGTLVPFLVGWAVASVVLGAYSGEARRSAKAAAATAGAAWVSAALVGQALRATPLFHGDATPAFVAVSVVVGLVLLVPWRVGVALSGHA